MLFLPMRCFVRFCYKLCSSSGGTRVLSFPELLTLVVDVFDGSASGQGAVEPASSAVTMSGSVRASSPYLVTIQRLSAHAFFFRLVASQAPMVGRPSSSAG